jgi:hypothetical protein
MAPTGGTQAAIGELQVTTGKIDGKLLELQTGVNQVLPLLPPLIANIAVDKWNDFVKVMREAWDYYWHLLENLGDPDKLRATATTWSTQVSSPVSHWQFLPDIGSLAADDNWDGTAADKYREGLTRQRIAVEKLRTTISEPAVTALNDLAGAITWFIWELVAALGALLVGIITAIALVETVIGAIIAGIAAGATFSSAVIGAMIKMKSDANGVKGKLRTAIDDWSGTVDGHWPMIVDTTGVALQPGG